MKRSLYIILSASILLLFTSTTAMASAIYQDFEPANGSNEYGWGFNAAVVTLSNAQVHSGARSWRIQAPDFWGGTGIQSQTQRWDMNFQPNRNDRLTFWIYAVPSQGNDNNVGVKFFDTTNYLNNGFEIWTTRTARFQQWTQLTVLFSQLPANFDLTHINKIEFINYWPGTYYLDDINVVLGDRIYQAFERCVSPGNCGWAWDGTVALERNIVHEGTQSWKLTTIANWAGTGIQSQENKFVPPDQQTPWNVDLNPAQNDRLTFWIYALAGNGLDNNVGVQFFDNGDHFVDPVVVWTTKRAVHGQWTQLTVFFSGLPADLDLSGINKIQFQFFWPGVYYIDDISAIKTPSTVVISESPQGVAATWNVIPGAGAYELQESIVGTQGPWTTIYEGTDLSYFIKPLSSRWLRARWKESITFNNPFPYVSQWSEIVYSLRPPVLLRNPRFAFAGLQWEPLEFADQYEIQKGRSRNGPWTEIYRGPHALLPAASYYEEGSWYRIRAHLRTGLTDIFDSTDWSPALPVTSLEGGYLKTEGMSIREMGGAGEPIILGGVNLGNLLLIEPEFTGIGGGYTAANPNDDDDFSIRAELVRRFGSANLLNAYQDAYIQTVDLDHLMRMGVNLVRLPIYYEALQDSTGAFTNFTKLDWIIEQCANRGIYVLLDLHGAPGAQSGEAHSGRANYNKLFENSPEGAAHRAKTIEFWRAVAARYAFLTNVVGYDILNEPFGAMDHDPTFTGPAGLWPFYNALYQAIRAVDPKHIIVMESVPSEFDWDTLPHPNVYGWQNIVYEFHYYGFEFDSFGNITGIKDVPGHRTYLDGKVNNSAQEIFNVPVFIGEFNGFNQRANWDYFLTTFRNKKWHWAMWTYKAHQTQYPTDWGLFMHEIYNDAPPDVSVDPQSVLQQKFGRYDTAAHHSPNISLTEILKGYLSVKGPARIVSPTPGSQIDTANVTFRWTMNPDATQYYLWLGTAPNTKNVGNINAGNNTSVAVNVPLDGTPLYASIWSKVKGKWVKDHEVSYTRGNKRAQITSPVPGSQITTGNVTFAWTANPAATQYYLWLGTAPNTKNVGNINAGTNTSVTVTVPLDGKALYASIWSRVNGIWVKDHEANYTRSLQ